MATKLSVFLANYSRRICFGEWKEYSCAVVANTESEALGLALERYSDTEAHWWHITPIDTSRVHLVEP